MKAGMNESPLRGGKVGAGPRMSDTTADDAEWKWWQGGKAPCIRPLAAPKNVFFLHSKREAYRRSTTAFSSVVEAVE